MSNIATVPPWEWTQAGSQDAPFEYEVPASQEVQPYTSTATYDGTNASGDFVPVVSIYSQSGNLLARVFPPVTVTMGDVAEVTYLPPFGSAATSSGGSSFTPVQLGPALQWGGSAGFYNFPSNGDGVNMPTQYWIADGFPAAITMSATYASVSGRALSAYVFNYDSASHAAFLAAATIQDIASTDRQTFLNISGSTALAAAARTELPWTPRGGTATLIDTSSAPPTWLNTGVYSVEATIQLLF